MSHIDDYPEKAKEQALIIESLKPYLHLLDTDYLKESNKKIREQASFQESASVLSVNYNSMHVKIMREQAKALESLIDFIKALKSIDLMKSKADKEDQNRAAIDNLFYNPKI